MVLEAMAMAQRGCVSALVGKAYDAVQTISAAIAAYRSTGATVWSTSFLSFLSLAYADLGKFNDAKRCIGQAITVIETAKKNGSRPRSIVSGAELRPLREARAKLVEEIAEGGVVCVTQHQRMRQRIRERADADLKRASVFNQGGRIQRHGVRLLGRSKQAIVRACGL